MTVNTEMFQQVHEQITRHPELHEQSDWDFQAECGTTYCAAGWALHLATGERKVEKAKLVYARDVMHEEFPEDVEIEAAADHLLGIDQEEGYHLYYNMTNEQAREYIKRRAEGDTTPWLADDVMDEIGRPDGCDCRMCRSN